MIDFSERLKQQRGIKEPEDSDIREDVRQTYVADGEFVVQPPVPGEASPCEQAALAYFAAIKAPEPRDEIEDKLRRVRTLYLEFLGNSGVLSIGASMLQDGMNKYLEGVAAKHGIEWKRAGPSL